MRGELFSLRLPGEVVPAKLPLHDLARILRAVEKAILSAMPAPPDTEKPQEVLLALVGLRAAGSTELDFACSEPDAGAQGVQMVTEAISAGQLDALPDDARRGLDDLTAYARERNVAIEFKQQGHVMAVIHPIEELAPEPTLVQGGTSVMGWVEGVGGRAPRVVLRTTRDKRISCPASEELAKQVAPRLYGWVVLEGTGMWDLDTGERKAFRAERLRPTSGKSWVKAFDSIRRMTSDHGGEAGR